jgi:hypothetical protein
MAPRFHGVAASAEAETPKPVKVVKKAAEKAAGKASEKAAEKAAVASSSKEDATTTACLAADGAKDNPHEPSPAKKPRTEADGPSPAKASPTAKPTKMTKPKKPPNNSHTTQAQWEAFYYNTACYVLERGPEGLRKLLGLTIKSMSDLAPAAIAKNKPALVGALNAWKENWRVSNCALSMKSTRKYGAAGILWWFALLAAEVRFAGRVVFKVPASRAAVEAAAYHWSEEAFVASDPENPQFRHFCFPGEIPTACLGQPDAERYLYPKEGKDTNSQHFDVPTFNSLPLLAARPVVISFLETFADELHTENNPARLAKLLEAIDHPLAKCISIIRVKMEAGLLAWWVI